MKPSLPAAARERNPRDDGRTPAGRPRRTAGGRTARSRGLVWKLGSSHSGAGPAGGRRGPAGNARLTPHEVDRLSSYIAAKGITTKEFAALVEVPFPTFRSWMSGHRGPSQEQRARLCRAVRPSQNHEPPLLPEPVRLSFDSLAHLPAPLVDSSLELGVDGFHWLKFAGQLQVGAYSRLTGEWAGLPLRPRARDCGRGAWGEWAEWAPLPGVTGWEVARALGWEGSDRRGGHRMVGEVYARRPGGEGRAPGLEFMVARQWVIRCRLWFELKGKAFEHGLHRALSRELFVPNVQPGSAILKAAHIPLDLNAPQGQLAVWCDPDSAFRTTEFAGDWATRTVYYGRAPNGLACYQKAPEVEHRQEDDPHADRPSHMLGWSDGNGQRIELRLSASGKDRAIDLQRDGLRVLRGVRVSDLGLVRPEWKSAARRAQNMGFLARQRPTVEQVLGAGRRVGRRAERLARDLWEGLREELERAAAPIDLQAGCTAALPQLEQEIREMLRPAVDGEHTQAEPVRERLYLLTDPGRPAGNHRAPGSLQAGPVEALEGARDGQWEAQGQSEAAGPNIESMSGRKASPGAGGRRPAGPGVGGGCVRAGPRRACPGGAAGGTRGGLGCQERSAARGPPLPLAFPTRTVMRLRSEHGPPSRGTPGDAGLALGGLRAPTARPSAG